VKPYNKGLNTLYRQYRHKTSLKANKNYCAKMAKLEHTELLALKAITYPTDTAADVKALIRAGAASEADLRSCAKARSFADLIHWLNLSAKANGRAHEAANLVRLDLNLPAVPG
jgi:hypothetical protein